MGKSSITDYSYLEQLSVEHDPEWVRPWLEELHEDSTFALGQLSRTIDEVMAMNLKDYKPEVAEAKKSERLLQARRAQYTFFAKHLQIAKDNIVATRAKILRQTELAKPSDPIAAIQQGFDVREIRDSLRMIDPVHRRDRIRGNLKFVQALIDAPVDIVSPDFVEECRREIAFRETPLLQQEEQEALRRYGFVKKRSGEINASSIKLLMMRKLNDPMPKIEHYSVFVPSDDHTMAFAQKHILDEQRLTDTKERKKKFAAVEEEAEDDRQRRKPKASDQFQLHPRKRPVSS